MSQCAGHDDLEDDATFFDTFVEQARGRTRSQLVATAIGAAISAFFFFQHSSVWLGAAFVSVSAYGCWGIADRWLTNREDGAPPRRFTFDTLIALRRIAGMTGVVAAFVSAATFMAAALGGWIH